LIVGLVALALSGCKEDLISDDPFYCTSDEQCATGWSCNTETNECIDGEYTPSDAGDEDGDEDTGDVMCDALGSAMGCPEGQRCVGVVDQGLVCQDSECTSDTDCMRDNQKCFLWTDQFGVCFDSGSKVTGTSCEFDRAQRSDTCNNLNWCVRRQGSDDARCAPTCTENRDCAGVSCVKFGEALSGYCDITSL
jgi:hypothetical protein